VRIALLTCEQSWQRALAARLCARSELSLIVVDQHLSASSRVSRASHLLTRPLALARKVRDKLAVRSIEHRDRLVYARAFDRIGTTPFEHLAATVRRVREINSPAVAAWLGAARPDLIVVSGTRLLRTPVLNAPSRLGMINLHTGLSPYYRGGPCTFWTLYNEEPEYAGATVHHLTAGIDSGDIILSARAELSAEDGVAALDARVIELGHQLVLWALPLLEQGRAPRVPNWEKGRLCRYRDFSAQVRLDLEGRLAKGLMARCVDRIKANPVNLRTVQAP
jgi:folate-dependent phosphoribosylglycinamide formyltransferase PurN